VADLVNAPAQRRAFTGLRAEALAANLGRVRERIAAAGGDPGAVEICAAVKYVAAGELPALAEAGIELVGENRAQDLLAKRAEHAGLFTWDFIGALQSRKVADIAGVVRLIHSVASDSALRRLEQHPAPEILVEVTLRVQRLVGRPQPEQILAVLPAASPAIGPEALERSGPTIEQVYDEHLAEAEFAIEVSYEGTIPLPEEVLKDGSMLDSRFGAMGGWVAATLVRLGDLRLDFLPPDPG